jgi:hypothetical protein
MSSGTGPPRPGPSTPALTSGRGQDVSAGTPVPARRTGADVPLALVAVLAALLTLVLAWRRLFQGMDLQAESYYVLVPWRWALGDKPFVHEQNLAQVSGFLVYPFVKAFGLLSDYHSGGLVLYSRHLYLGLMVVVAVVAFLVLRRLVRWELALAVVLPFLTFVYRATPQLSYDTMGAAFLTLGAALGVTVLALGGGRRWAFASGVAYGLAVVAYPTLLFVAPFVAVFLALALGERATEMLARLSIAEARGSREGESGRRAWRAVSAWVLGGLVVVVPFAVYVLSFGVRTLERCWSYTVHAAQGTDVLGGAPKAVEVARDFFLFVWSAPYVLIALVVVYLMYLRWPRWGRAALVLVPLVLWRAGQHGGLDAAGYVIAYAVLTAYLYLFLPERRRETGAKLVLWVWLPALFAGAMTAFTSSAGYRNAAVGLLPALLSSGLFLTWALEPASGGGTGAEGTEAVRRSDAASAAPPRRATTPWLALVALLGVVAVTLVLQVQFQQEGRVAAELTRRCDFGPWWGISVTPERYEQLLTFAADLRSEARRDDQLLVFYQTCGLYLFWDGGIAANSYALWGEHPSSPLPQSTVEYYRRYRVVPTLALHVLDTRGMSGAQLTAACGGLAYPPIVVRPWWALQRRPAGETTGDVLARLPRR